MRDHPDVAKWMPDPFPVVVDGDVDLHVSDEEYAQWEADRAAAVTARERPATNPQAEAFMTMLRTMHGEQAPVTHLRGVWDRVQQAWLLDCPHCDEGDELYRPLTVARNGHVRCATGCSFHAMLAAVPKLRRRV